jgi:hypothetical protein
MTKLLRGLDFRRQAAPAAPLSGYVSAYIKTDGLLYTKDSAGAEKAYREIGPFAKLYASTASAALPRSASQKIALDTAAIDSHSGFDAVNNRYVFPQLGWYRISYVARGSAYTSLAEPTSLQSWISLNADTAGIFANERSVVRTTSDVIVLSGSDVVQVAALTDYVELFTYYTNGTAGSTYVQSIVAARVPSMTIEFIRP